ncbi:MetQ/NlpA family ABC transporter substrate-binding protein [Lysinibacillus sp. KU-BSD001]|uniref:MetQ/NlpA family ABC transporter substrate-binding protein n=1 Tax=Lysinibacillus sp. KU-BSD001 TaxID=3141328 RepID=UPI0036E9C5F5
MKKYLSLLAVPSLALALGACGSDDEKPTNDTATNDAGETAEDTKIVVGASNGLHELILKEAEPILEEEGIDLEIKPYQDYIMPNQDLESGDLDANYFQHIPYLELEIAEKGYDFVNAGGIHIEPIGIYSQKYKSLDELPDGATIIISNSVSDQGRILQLLEAQGLITLKEDIDKTAATIDDIVDNPKKLVIDASSAPELLVTYYEEGEGDAVVINSNFAIDAGINPLEDSIAIEGSESPYVNVIAVRSEDKDSEAIARLVEVLRSEPIQEFILEEWGGAVVPVSE